jgi:hypothetical protein
MAGWRLARPPGRSPFPDRSRRELGAGLSEGAYPDGTPDRSAISCAYMSGAHSPAARLESRGEAVVAADFRRLAPVRRAGGVRNAAEREDRECVQSARGRRVDQLAAEQRTKLSRGKRSLVRPLSVTVLVRPVTPSRARREPAPVAESRHVGIRASPFPQTTTRLRAAAASGRQHGADQGGSSFRAPVRVDLTPSANAKQTTSLPAIRRTGSTSVGRRDEADGRRQADRAAPAVLADCGG